VVGGRSQLLAAEINGEMSPMFNEVFSGMSGDRFAHSTVNVISIGVFKNE
jgi:hypothetical protein